MIDFILFCFSLYGVHRSLHVLTHAFPTLRSSDLVIRLSSVRFVMRQYLFSWLPISRKCRQLLSIFHFPFLSLTPCHRDPSALMRSEEHTSELQSLMSTSYSVFCLKTTTTEKKKTNHR